VVAALIIGVFALFGQQILLWIRLPTLEAAGGLLLLVAALDLLRGDIEGCQGREGQRRLGAARHAIAGRAGAITAIMVLMREASTAAERVGIVLGLVGVLVVLWLPPRFAGVVRRVLGHAGSRVCC
jgi:multiple antibiotic resistance protein